MNEINITHVSGNHTIELRESPDTYHYPFYVYHRVSYEPRPFAVFRSMSYAEAKAVFDAMVSNIEGMRQ
jgi:hypothetical protein